MIVVFFDLNPARRRDLFDSPCHHFVRLSYGPKMETLEKGLDGIERILKRYEQSTQLEERLQLMRSRCAAKIKGVSETVASPIDAHMEIE